MRPGTSIVSQESPPPQSSPTDTGTWFVVGTTDRGPVDSSRKVYSIAEFEKRFGLRQTYSILWDAVDAFFREGGNAAVIGRVVGPAPVLATRTLVDRAGAPLSTLRIEAKNPGAWGNGLTVEVINGGAANTFVLIIREAGVEVERSPDQANPAAAATWSALSDYVNVVNLASATVAPNNNPLVLAASALTLGNDDRVNAADAQWATALGLFYRDLGPGQVSMPGRTTGTAHTELLSHAQARNRVALLDPTDTTDSNVLITAANNARINSLFERHGALFAPWLRAPGILGGTERDVPPSALAAGLIARSDVSNSPNVPAAGENGRARYILNVKASWSDPLKESLNANGVNVIRSMNSSIRLYGFRTLVDSTVPNWRMLSNARLFMKIIAEGEAIAEQFVFAQIDGRRRKISEYGSQLIGMLLDLYGSGSLYGDTPEEAFSVDVGPNVNTLASIAAQELKAVLAVKASPYAELVVLEIVKVNTLEAVS